jgi:hypothetical protein
MANVAPYHTNSPEYPPRERTFITTTTTVRMVAGLSLSTESQELRDVRAAMRASGSDREGSAMATGKDAASKAGKELGSKKSTKAEKEVAGSDLAQRKPGSGQKSGGKKK